MGIRHQKARTGALCHSPQAIPDDKIEVTATNTMTQCLEASIT